MIDHDFEVKFKHKTENGMYKVWVYSEGFNSPVDLFSGKCKAHKKRKCQKLYETARQVTRYYRNIEDWEDAL